MQSPSFLSDLLRRPSEVAERCHEERELKPVVITSLLVLVVGAAVFGGTVGTFRGEAQIAFSALKLPAAMLGSLILCAPAFHGIGAALGEQWTLRTSLALTLSAAARSAMLLFALTPLLWLAIDLGLGYHASALGAAAAFSFSLVAGLGVLLRGLKSGLKPLTSLLFAGVFIAASAQSGWLLRPYLVRPQSEGIPFVRALEGSFADSLALSARSMLGFYRRNGKDAVVVPEYRAEIPQASAIPRAADRATGEDDADMPPTWIRPEPADDVTPTTEAGSDEPLDDTATTPEDAAPQIANEPGLLRPSRIHSSPPGRR